MSPVIYNFNCLVICLFCAVTTMCYLRIEEKNASMCVCVNLTCCKSILITKGIMETTTTTLSTTVFSVPDMDELDETTLSTTSFTTTTATTTTSRTVENISLDTVESSEPVDNGF